MIIALFTLFIHIFPLSKCIVIDPSTTDPNIEITLDETNYNKIINNSWYLKTNNTNPNYNWPLSLKLLSNKYSFKPNTNDSMITITMHGKSISTSQSDMFYIFSDNNQYLSFAHDFDGLIKIPTGSGLDAGLWIFPQCNTPLPIGNPSTFLSSSLPGAIDAWRSLFSNGNNTNWYRYTDKRNENTWPVTFQLINNDIDKLLHIKFFTDTVNMSCTLSTSFATNSDFYMYISPDQDNEIALINSFDITEYSPTMTPTTMQPTTFTPTTYTPTTSQPTTFTPTTSLPTTVEPTTVEPTTAMPTTYAPTMYPTLNPTLNPTINPTYVPTIVPTECDCSQVTSAPSTPTIVVAGKQTFAPTDSVISVTESNTEIEMTGLYKEKVGRLNAISFTEMLEYNNFLTSLIVSFILGFFMCFIILICVYGICLYMKKKRKNDEDNLIKDTSVTDERIMEMTDIGNVDITTQMNVVKYGEDMNVDEDDDDDTDSNDENNEQLYENNTVTTAGGPDDNFADR